MKELSKKEKLLKDESDKVFVNKILALLLPVFQHYKPYKLKVMKSLPILLLLILTFTSCETQPLEIENEDIKFNLPVGWIEKQADEPVEGNKLYVFQKGRFVAKGLVTLVIRQDVQDLASLIKFYGKSLDKLEVGPLKVETNFEHPLPGKFGKYESLTTSFVMKVFGVNSNGQMHAFHYSNKTFLISIQEVSGNKDVYEEVIKKMQESLVLK